MTSKDGPPKLRRVHCSQQKAEVPSEDIKGLIIDPGERGPVDFRCFGKARRDAVISRDHTGPAGCQRRHSGVRPERADRGLEAGASKNPVIVDGGINESTITAKLDEYRKQYQFVFVDR